MYPGAMSNNNSTSLSEETSVSSGTKVHDFGGLNLVVSTFSPNQQQQQHKIKKKRNLPGNPDPDAEVIALSPKTLMATNRFVCEICNKGFQRDQNLQLHRRGHNLPWKLKQRSSKEIKKRAYVCPEPTCIHHHPSRALGDLTGIKKHFCRKHGEKKWKCEKCSKIYAVQSDWKAHSKTCGTREYRCDCGTLFSRKDSFITHRAFCDALAEESARLSAATTNPSSSSIIINSQNPSSLFSPPPPFTTQHHHNHHHHQQQHFQNPPPLTHISLTSWNTNTNPPQNHHHQNPNSQNHFQIKNELPLPLPLPPPPTTSTTTLITSPCFQNLLMTAQPNTATSSAHLSATALLQKASTVGATAMSSSNSMTRLGHHMDEFPPLLSRHHMVVGGGGGGGSGVSPEYMMGYAWQKNDRLTRDFLGLNGEDDHCGGGGGGGNVITFTGGVDFTSAYGNNHERDHTILKPQQQLQGCFGYAEPAASETWGDC